MIHLEFRFPGGRYHATPWGHHVNEGLVEWPPSPWRLVRAFIATAFTKLDVRDPVPADHPLRRLVATLATQLPSFRAAPCLTTHSRHYMPLGKFKGGTHSVEVTPSPILDACAVPGDSPLFVSWSVDLDPECTELLLRIVESLGYLGRAESWVVGRMLADAPPADASTFEMRPHDSKLNKGPGWEQVSLFAPISDLEYAACYEAARLGAEKQFPAPPEKKLPGAISKQRAEALEPYPTDLFACLTTDTAFLQQHGWSQPPGSRRVLYWRPTNALSVAPAGRSNPPARIAPVEAILLSLASNTRQREVLPQFSRALPQAELLHRALVSRMDGLPADVCAIFTGKDSRNERLTGHRHIHYIPLNLEQNAPGSLDHVLLWAPMGFDSAAQQAVLATPHTWTKGGDKPLFVTVAGMGCLEDFRPLLGAKKILGPARVWSSRTPFVAPRFVKRNGSNTLVNQVRAELASRGLPDATVEILSRDQSASLRLHRFIRKRRDASKAPPQDHFLALRLTFEKEISGPISLGYAAHFGLGLFVPVVE